MKVAFLCCVLLLAGSASSSSVEANSISLSSWSPNIDIPDWILDLISRLPESIQEIVDKLPEIIAAIPEFVDKLPDIIAEVIEKLPELIPAILEKILEKLPEIIDQIPAAVDKIKEVIEQIIEKLPELIPIILEKIEEGIAALPELLEKIREILEGLELPDWLPTLPEWDKPEWWPELPSLPEYNKPVPGTPTTVSEFPGIVQIEVGTGPIWIQGCVGNIMNSFNVLTSARCTSGPRFSPRFRRVNAGSSSRFDRNIVIEVELAIVHPSFGSGELAGDIALIRLYSPLTFGPNIQQTPIVPGGFILPSGLTVTSVSFGSTAQGKLIADRDLYKIDLTVIDRANCASRWAKIPLVPISDSKICVGRYETGGRNGDVRDMGAPIYYQNILVGTVSISVQVGNQYFPIVTTSTASYTDWIIANAN